jgi:hypothetical protein
MTDRDVPVTEAQDLLHRLGMLGLEYSGLGQERHAATIADAINALTIQGDALQDGLVERVAQAIHAVEESWNDTPWEYVPVGAQDMFRLYARAALSVPQ